MLARSAAVTLLAVLAGSAAPDAARAQPYPARTITGIVPYAAGGPLDLLARVMVERMKVTLGQSIVIENVGGAGGSTGAIRGARAAPDGYTLSFGNWGSHVANGALYNLPFDLLVDLAPVSLIASEVNMIIGRPTLPAASLAELIGWLKSNPDKATAGTSGVGGPSHVSALLFQRETGTRFSFVSYRGAAPALQDLIAGQIDFMMTGQSLVLSQLRAGTIKAYAVTDAQRSSRTPDIPSAAEAGVPGLNVSVWSGIWVPKGSPGEIIARLEAAVRDALTTPESRQKLGEVSLDLPASEQLGPAPLAAFHKAEIIKWWPVIKAANIKVE